MSANKGELPIAAFENAFITYSAMMRQPVRFILNQAQFKLGKTWELKELGDTYSEKTLHANIRLLRKIGIIRSERYGNTTNYSVNYDRLETIKGAAARLLT